MPDQRVEVWDHDVLAGLAYLHPSRSGVAVEFSYHDAFLGSSRARPIDPALSLYAGAQTLNDLPGAFSDASPDAWGRYLIGAHMVMDRAGRRSDAVNSTDDHLRNHGFLWARGGWGLSPMFDVVPTTGRLRKTSIAGAVDRDDAVSGLIELASFAGIEAAAAINEIKRVWTATATWRQAARRAGVSTASSSQMSPAFDALRAEVENL